MKPETIRSTLFSCSLALCTIGAAVFGIGAAHESLSNLIAIPDAIGRIMLAVGGASIAVGVLTLIAAGLISPARLVSEGRSLPDLDRYVCFFATAAEIRELHTIYTEYFGGEVATPDVMQLMVRRFRKAFSMIYLVEDSSLRDKKRTLVGSFKILPVTEEAVHGLELRELTGSTLKPEHIASRQSDAAGFYVGDVFATTTMARGMVMAYINVSCEPALKRGLPIYARPLTREGKRVMKRRGFVRVADGKSPPEIGEICRLIVPGGVSPSRWRKPRKQQARKLGAQPTLAPDSRLRPSLKRHNVPRLSVSRVRPE